MFKKGDKAKCIKSYYSHYLEHLIVTKGKIYECVLDHEYTFEFINDNGKQDSFGDFNINFERLEDFEIVNNPKHYDFVIKPIDAIKCWNLNFNLGCVVEYLVRLEKNHHLEDLKKAKYYLEYEIKHLEQNESNEKRI